MQLLLATLVFIVNAQAEDYALQRCNAERKNATKNCRVVHSAIHGECGTNLISCFIYSQCTGSMSDISISASNVPASETQSSYRNCIISGVNARGNTHQEIASSFNTALVIDAEISGKLTTTIVTNEGSLICEQASQATQSYDNCYKKMNTQKERQKISLISGKVMNQLYFKKTSLEQIGVAPIPLERPSPMPQAIPVSQ
jgi:hypothetical protein